MLGVRIASTLALTSVAATALLTGCGADRVPSAATPVPSSTARSSSPSSSGSSASSAAPSSASSPSVRPSAAPSAGSGSSPTAPGGRHKVDRFRLGLRPGVASEADAHLLGAARVPQVAGAAWTRVDPTDDPTNDQAVVGACQKTGLASIGAMEEARRSFTAPGGLTATEVVARFPDARSAWRAHGVLVAWHDDCEQRVSGAAVGPLEPVVVPVGNSDGYRGSYSSRPRTAGLAILRTGTWLTLFEVSAPSAYPRHWDPARVALRRASRTF